MESEIPTITMSAELLAAIAGTVLSLAFSYIPKLNTKFAEMTAESKRLIMAGLLLLTTVIIYGLGCLEFVMIPGFVCNQGTAVQFVWIFIWAVITNQATYTISPQTAAVRSRKA